MSATFLRLDADTIRVAVLSGSRSFDFEVNAPGPRQPSGRGASAGARAARATAQGGAHGRVVRLDRRLWHARAVTGCATEVRAFLPRNFLHFRGTRAALSALLALGLLGCGSRERGKPAPAGQPSASSGGSPPAASAQAPAARAYAPPPQKPLSGLFCEGEGGLWRLRPDGGTDPVLAVWPSLGGAPREPGLVREGSVGPDGSLYVAATAGILRVGDPMVAPWYFPEGDPRGKKIQGDHLAFGAGFALWDAFHLLESPVFPPRGVEDFSEVEIPGEKSSIQGVVYDARQRLWVATSDAVHVRENGAWTRAELPAYPTVKGLALWQGVAHVLLRPKLAAYPDGPASPRVVAELPEAGEELVAGKHGLVVLMEPRKGTRGGRLVRLDGAAARPLAGGLDHLIGYDERGTLWGREKDGFAAIEADGRHTLWPKGSIPVFSRGFTRYCHVAGGYEVLPAVNPVRHGSVKGTLVNNGKPVASARIELCEEMPWYSFSTKTPCGGHGVSGKTDAQGAFSLGNVPIGKYHLVVDLGDKWKGTSPLDSLKIPAVTEGGVADYETLDIK